MRIIAPLLVVIACADAARVFDAQQSAGFFNRFQSQKWGAEDEWEEEEEPNGLGRLALKAVAGVGLAAAGSAAVSFGRRVIQAKKARQASPNVGGKSSSASSSPAPPPTTTASSTTSNSFPESRIKGGKTEAKAPPAAADESVAEAEEPEEVFEPEEVKTLEESKLSSEQLNHPYAKLLGPKLVKYDKIAGKLVEVPTADALDGKVTSLFFHAHQVEQMLEKMKAGKVLPGLLDVYKEQKALGNNFEIVFASLPDGQEGRFQTYLKDMPWYAIPFSNTDKLRDIYKAFKVQNLPAAVIMDEEAHLINDKGFTYMLINRNDFPWRPKSLTDMMGNKFINNQKQSVPADEVASKKVLGLYFSANWCKPCREFTPKLIEMYNQFKAEGKEFEVIFVSMDETQEKFDEYFAEMPWLSMPYEDKQTRSLLMTELEVRGLPSLVILDEERKVITTKGRDFALKDPSGEKFPWHPQPLNEVSYSFDGIAQKPSLVVFMEGATGDVQGKIVTDLQNVAEEYVGKSKENPEDEANRFNFFYAKDVSTFSKALRSIVGLDQVSPKDKFLKSKAESNKPRLVLLDIAKEVCHVSDSNDITEAGVRAVLEGKAKGTLELQSFKQPEPNEEEGAPQSTL